MKIKEVRKVREREQKSVPSGCDSAPGDGPDKPPC